MASPRQASRRRGLGRRRLGWRLLMAAAGVPAGGFLILTGVTGQMLPAYAATLTLPSPTLLPQLPLATPTPTPTPTLLPPPPTSIVQPTAIAPTPAPLPGTSTSGSGGTGSTGTGGGTSTGSGGTGTSTSSGSGSGSSGGSSGSSSPGTRKADQTQSNQDAADARDQQRAQAQQKQEAQILADLPALEKQYDAIALAAGGGTGRFGPPELIDPKHPTPITQAFGCTPWPFEPYDKDCESKHFHTGTDIAGPDLTPIFASDAGVVAIFQTGVGYGNYAVVTDGNGYQTLYGHMDKPLVKTGDVVQRGDVLGLEGSSGNSTGPHLHFEIRYKGAFVDPCAELNCSGHDQSAVLLPSKAHPVDFASAPPPTRWIPIRYD